MTCETAFRFLLAALASWRISFLLVREKGPWNAIERLRDLSGQMTPLRCVKCTGIWVAVPFAWFVGGTWTEMLVEWMALAGVIAIIDEALRSPFEVHDTSPHP